MKLSWFIRPDWMMRRAYAIGTLAGVVSVFSLRLFM